MRRALCLKRYKLINSVSLTIRDVQYQESKQVNTYMLTTALKACSSLEHLEFGVQMHRDATETQQETNIYVATALIDMYGKCGNMRDARNVFDTIICPDTASWNALLLGYATNGEEETCLEMFLCMKDRGYPMNDRTFVSALIACSSLAKNDEVGQKVVKLGCLERGMQVHLQAVLAGYETNSFVGNALINLYSKCGSLLDARAAFDRLENPDVVSWTTLLMGYVENEEGLLAMELFDAMVSTGREVNSRTFVAGMMACSLLAESESGHLVNGKLIKLESLRRGMSIHSQVKDGCQLNMFVLGALVDMYAKCGSLCDAFGVFEHMAHHDVVSFTAMIMGYAENGEGELALELFESMQCAPNARTFVAALMACSGIALQEEARQVDGCFVKIYSLGKGRSIHKQAAEYGYDIDVFVANNLVDMYAKCWSLEEGRKVFNLMPSRSVVARTALMLGYVENGEAESALSLFSEESCVPDCRSFVIAFMACALLASNEEGKVTDTGKVVKVCSLQKGTAMHSQAAVSGYDLDIFVATALVDMYAKCGSMVSAKQLFERLPQKDVVVWNALMLGYVENGEGEFVFDLFKDMEKNGCLPDSQTFVAALTACASFSGEEERKQVNGRIIKVGCLEKGMAIHSEAVRTSNNTNVFVSSALVDVYVKCGSMLDARVVFDKMPYRDIISWNALILGYVEDGEAELALEIFTSMRDSGFLPDSWTYIAALKACGNMVELEAGRHIHAEICMCGLESSTISNSLVDYYGKCGKMEAAHELFDCITDTRNVYAWNSLISGYSHRGDARRVFEVFERMRGENIRPNDVTYLSVLAVCSHSGLVKRGMEVFESMRGDGVIPRAEHLSCIVDLLGRANRLEEAMVMIERMSLQHDCVAWTGFLSSCVKWRDVKMGKVAYEKLVGLDSKQSGNYSLMGNLYASVGMWEEQSRVMASRKIALGY